jgi:hypothetical protein
MTAQAAMAYPRCVMVTHGFDDLPQDSDLLRAIVRDAEQNLGIYASPSGPGSVALGDPVELLP